MSHIFVTGGTGYLGGYTAKTLLETPGTHLYLLTRGGEARALREKLWKSWQLHFTPQAFGAALQRVTFIPGDLHAPGLGIADAHRSLLTERADSVLHIAASLNRKSAKACLNTNLRGTLSVIQLARHLKDAGKLSRFSHVSTVAVAGHRHAEVVQEDDAIDWDRSDYDPYGRTKKFCEHMVRELLPDVPKTFFRPSIVMGDSTRPHTSQFDMVRAFCVLVDLPVLPLSPDVRLDIVPADWVGRAIATLHLDPKPKHSIYHLSAGHRACTARQIAASLGAAAGRTPRFAPALGSSFDLAVRAANRAPRGTMVAGIGALLKVFWPYIIWDTVFDSERAVAAVGAPAPFPDYAAPLYRWSKEHDFRYPHEPYPEGLE